jgi:hypothetical protein
MDRHVYTFLSSSNIFSFTLPTSTQNLRKISSLARPQPPAIFWSPLSEQCSSRIKSNFWTLTLSSSDSTSHFVSSCISEFIPHLFQNQSFLCSVLGFLHKPPSFLTFSAVISSTTHQCVAIPLHHSRRLSPTLPIPHSQRATFPMHPMHDQY